MTWLARKEAFLAVLADLNRKVRNYNLICPPASQMIQFDNVEEVKQVRRGARGILGYSTSVQCSAGTAPVQKRLMTPLREVLGTRRQSVGGSGRSMWSRVKDAMMRRSTF